MRMPWVAVCTLLVGMAGAQPAPDTTVKALGRPSHEQLASLGITFDANDSRAVLIGVGNFDDERVSSLRYAVDDAVDLAHRFWELGLIAPKGIALLTSGVPSKAASKARLDALVAAGMQPPRAATKSAVLRALADATRTAGPKGLLLVSASSHGYYHNIDAILTKDTVLDLKLESGTLAETSLSHARLVGLVQGSNCPRKLVLIDACREKLTNTASIGGVSPLSGDAMRALASAKGMAVLTATTTGGFGFDGGKALDGSAIENGVFTYYILDTLTRGTGDATDPEITLGDVADAVDRSVRAWTRARWSEERGIGQGNLEGDWKTLPLAVNPEAMEARRQAREAAAKAEQERLAREKEEAEEAERQARSAAKLLSERLQAARLKLATAAANDDALLRLMPQVIAALNEWEPARQDRLLRELEAVDPANERTRNYFLKIAWPEMAPTAAPTPAPSPSPRPTAEPTPRETPAPSPSATSSQPSIARPGSRAGERATITVNGVEFAFRWCPPGTFMMGSPLGEQGRNDDEGPRTRVTLTKGFWMGETEVTQGQWTAIMGTTVANQRVVAGYPSLFGSGETYPMYFIGWNEIVESYIDRLSSSVGVPFSLPTEAQWEYACRAGTTTRYCFGDAVSPLGEFAWYAENSGRQSHPVGQKKANDWGLYDMHGNVWEWCLDRHTDWLPGVDTTDYIGPNAGYYRVLRGGSWINDPPDLRSANRHRFTPVIRDSALGVRICLPL
ncbi:SUMF1/EgtB/PvdO family nonheme iron enzyme [bacterium]|nr:SUMF1/EgtB/PvdO family nonheme iron enzyme [bacterium]